MDDLWTLILLSLAMLIGCYLSGSIPLAVSLSEDRLKLVTVFGAGLLVGTALAVIIPEGVHAMYSAAEGSAHVTESLEIAVKSPADASGSASGSKVQEHDHEHSAEGGSDLHTWIGVTLVLGFVFMLLVDQLSSSLHGRSSSMTADTESGTLAHHRGRIGVTATLGLVVHAAADGIALGAAASTSQTHVEMIVFIAIMLHKAPASFGLVSFLLHEGLDRTRIRKHLFVFSLAAPLLAVITFFGLGHSSKEALSNVNATGIAMLFSGGTFLYVATVHILPEVNSLGPVRVTQPDGTILIQEQKGFTKLELTLLVTGSLLPLVLSLSHHH